LMPPEVAKSETGGAMLRFSASPSFNWQAIWQSQLWRLATGELWIGQVVNRFDASWAFLDTPVSYKTNLLSWSDASFSSFPEESGMSTGFGLSTWAFVQPTFFYNCWVWIGGTVYGDAIDFGTSGSDAVMNANVSSLVLDTF
jgi:isocitrate lyase